MEGAEIGYAAFKGARLGAIISEFGGPEAVPFGVVIGGALGVGAYFYDRNTHGNVSRPVNTALGICPK